MGGLGRLGALLGLSGTLTNTRAIGSLCWSPGQLQGGTLPCWTGALVCRVSLPSCANDGPRGL
eukprot:3134476-Pyramimonas_sp.AAC.1